MLKVNRTIADLEITLDIQMHHGAFNKQLKALRGGVAIPDTRAGAVRDKMSNE